MALYPFKEQKSKKKQKKKGSKKKSSNKKISSKERLTPGSNTGKPQL
jgi:hypothetical protein